MIYGPSGAHIVGKKNTSTVLIWPQLGQLPKAKAGFGHRPKALEISGRISARWSIGKLEVKLFGIRREGNKIIFGEEGKQHYMHVQWTEAYLPTDKAIMLAVEIMRAIYGDAATTSIIHIVEGENHAR